MSKKVAFGKKPRPGAAEADTWVDSRGEEAPSGKPPVKLKRLTIDIPADLHRRLKADCAGRDIAMADVIREMLERQYG